jgi:hypothetical protein
MGGAEKILNYLIDHQHRWAGANPERGLTHRAPGYRENELYRGVKKGSWETRKKVDNNKSEGLLARDSKI